LTELPPNLDLWAYNDLRSILYQGFITKAVRISSGIVLLRSSFPGDPYRTGHFVQSGQDRSVSSTAIHIWMYNGRTFGVDEYVYERIQWLKNIRITDFKSLQWGLEDLKYRYNKAMVMLVPYCYTRESRNQWKLRRGVTNPCVHPAMNAVSFNSIRAGWNNYNIAEDDFLSSQESWLQSVMSIGNPKGYKSAKNSIDNRTVTLRDDRSYEATKVMASYLDFDMSHFVIRGKSNILERTNEQLLATWKMLKDGKEDDHESIVRLHKEIVWERHKEHLDLLEQDKQKHYEEFEGKVGLVSSSISIGPDLVSGDEAKEVISAPLLDRAPKVNSTLAKWSSPRERSADLVNDLDLDSRKNQIF
jgi:hypothetical protein